MRVNSSRETAFILFMFSLTLGIMGIFALLSEAFLGGVFLSFALIITLFGVPPSLPKYVEIDSNRIVVKGSFTKRVIEIERISEVYERRARWRGGTYLEIKADQKGGKIKSKSYDVKYLIIRELILKLKETKSPSEREAVLSQYSKSFEGLDKPLRYYIGMLLCFSSTGAAVGLLLAYGFSDALVWFIASSFSAIAGLLVAATSDAEYHKRLSQRRLVRPLEVITVKKKDILYWILTIATSAILLLLFIEQTVVPWEVLRPLLYMIVFFWFLVATLAHYKKL